MDLKSFESRLVGTLPVIIITIITIMTGGENNANTSPAYILLCTTDYSCGAKAERRHQSRQHQFQGSTLAQLSPHPTPPVFPERNHVVCPAGVVIEGVLGQHELGVALELPNVHRLPSWHMKKK